MLNHIFKTKFDVATGLSYAVSELGKNHVSRNAKVASAVVIGALSVMSGSVEAANCPVEEYSYTGGVYILANNTTCDIVFNPADKIYFIQSNNASTLTSATGISSFIPSGYKNSTVDAAWGVLAARNKSKIIINGDVDISFAPDSRITNNQDFIASEGVGSELIINGNYRSHVLLNDDTSSYLQNLSVWQGKLKITGDVDISTLTHRVDRSVYSSMFVHGGGELEVGGDVQIKNFVHEFRGGYTHESEHFIELNKGKSHFAKNFTVHSNLNSGVSVLAGTHNIGGDLAITMDYGDNNPYKYGSKQVGLYLEAGELNVAGKATIKTVNDFVPSDDMLKSPYGIHVKSDTIDGLVFATGSFANSAEATVERDVKKLLLDKGSTVMTSGEGATAVKLDVTNASVKLVNKGDITGKNADAIDASGSVTGRFDYQVTVINEGNIIAKENTGHVFLGSVDNDSFTSSAGVLGGKIAMAGGNDELILSGTDISKLVSIDGGNGDGSLDKTEQNTFVLNQNLTGSTTSAGEPNNAKIANWTTINVAKDKEATLTLTGDLLSGKANDGVGDMTIGSQGKLELAPNTATSTVGYNVVNEGKIDLVKGTDADNPTAKMTIKGNYEGKDGSQLIVKSIWNNPDVQKNDLLVIDGNATGNTLVKISNKILGDVTAAEAEKNGALQNPVITVNGTDAGTFTGSAATSNAGEAQLKREGNSYYWTLKAKLPDLVVPPSKPSDPAKPTTPVTPVEPQTVDIISKPVVGYVQQGFINRKMGLDQLGRLHERVGEQRNAGWENGNAVNQVWGRMNLDYTALQGRSRFGADVKSGFVQFGRDINFKLNDDKSQQHTGLTFTYGWANSKFFDKYRAENGVVVADKFTGSAKSDMLSIGGYHTYYSSTGAYVDLVGQVSWLQNRYRSGNSQVKQNGYGFGASIEVGKPYHLLNPQVTVEPQAQLSYQSIWLNGFNDGVRQVKKSRQDSLVGRLGVRVNWSETLDKNSPQVYFTANLIQTLAGKGSAITVGREQVKERFGDLAAEFGLGGQYPISQNLSVYADARYVIGIQDRNRVHRDSSLSRRSYHGRIGLRYSW